MLYNYIEYYIQYTIMSRHGRTLDPDRSLQSAHGAKVIRQKVVIVNNPSTIGENEELRVSFPNLGPHDVIVPGTARLAFDIAISSSDGTRTLVQNVGRAIVNKITVKISGNQVLSVDDADIIGCFQDMWKSKGELCTHGRKLFHAAHVCS